MTAYKEKTDVVVTPATWKAREGGLERTTTHLRNLVGWFGSTHTSAVWRKDHEFLDVFREMNVTGFDPQVIDWEEYYMEVESEVLATASVIVIRLENNELLNGSLGSIAEIGVALTSAALRGQVVIISIEEGLLTSLNEPGAIAQYMMVEMSLENVEKIPGLTGYLRIHRGDDLRALAVLACETAQQQMNNPQQSLQFDSFLTKKERRRQNYPLRVLLGGSGGPYTEVYTDIFQKKKKSLTLGYREEDQVKILSEGAIAEAWKIPYGSIDNIGVALATRTLLSIETEFKTEADMLVLPIMSEAASKAASTEIGLLLLHALNTGQDVKIMMEPFDPVDYIHHQLQDVDIQNCSDEKSMREALRCAGVSAVILATAVQTEIFETFGIFKALMNENQPTFRQVQKSLLGKTEAFHRADNVRRVRALVQAHLERLAADARFPDFFSFSTRIEI